MKDVGVGFRDVDSQDLPELVHCLDFINALPVFRSYKSLSWEALDIRREQLIVDVACGVGFDAIELAKQFAKTSFIGVDLSQKFLDLAERRADGLPNLSFRRGDAESLPLESDEADAARVDRSLQHMSNPRAAISEMRRIIRPGGRIVATEPDWGSFILYNGELETSSRIANEFRGSIRNPHIGRELGALFNECGVKQIQSRIHPLYLHDVESADVVFDLNRVIGRCVDSQLLGDEDARRWLRDAQTSSANGAFMAYLNIVEFSGVVQK